MLSLVSGASGCLELYPSMSCDSRRAQAMPAGPPPTMTTSASIAGRSMRGSGLRKTIIRPTNRFGENRRCYCHTLDPDIVTLQRYYELNIKPAPEVMQKRRAQVGAPVVAVTKF